MSKFKVVLDACVLYPAPLRDLLMRLAATNLFKAHWTDQIHEEWINALLRQGKYQKETLVKVSKLMDKHVQDAKVYEYESLIANLDLPDPNDRHVLAAAIKSGADALVTFNLKDFPSEQLAPYGLIALHPDDFIYQLIDLAPVECCVAIKKQRKALKTPPLTALRLLEVLQQQQLPQTVSKLKDYLEFI